VGRKEDAVFWKDRGGLKPETKSPTLLPVSPKPVETQLVTPVPVLRASLGPDTAVSGRLSFTVPTRIDGRLRGEVRASDLLVVGEEAVVEGVVRAQKLVVLGEVRGDIRGADLVEIGPGGRLMGTVETHSLVVKEGGCLDGDCRIAPARSPLRVLQPVPATSA
jgi:cytoskeletal protein CcmA (bactofilin family)